MLVLTRHRVPGAGQDAFLTDARAALAVLAARPGYLRGSVGRAVDDGELFVVRTEWADVGSYRRALSAYDVKVQAVPLLSTAVDEPTAFEVLLHAEDGELSEGSSARAAGASG